MYFLKSLSALAVVAALAAITACSAPLPEATPAPPEAPLPTETPTMPVRPTATPLPQPAATVEPTPLPTPGATPTPPSGYFRDAELGFWLTYPDDWSVENTGGELPAVIFSDPDDPVKVMAGSTIIESGLDQETVATTVVEQLGLAEEVSFDSNETAALGDGTTAQAVSVSWSDEDGIIMMGQGLVTAANGRGFIVLLYGRPEVVEARPRTVEAIAGSLRLEQPELFGVSRQNALVLSLLEPATLDPALTHEDPAGVIGHVFSGLVRLNPELGIDADIGEGWDVSQDGLVYTFHLRQDAQFHDGRPITAADVVASWERATNPQLGSATAAGALGDIVGVAARLAGESDTISGLELLDPSTLQVTIDGPKPYFLFKLTQPAAFVVDQDNLALGSQWWRQPNGSGPFRLRSWRPGNVIVLEQNEAFQPVAPAIESVIYYLGQAGLPAYEAGQVDAAQVEYWNLARARDPGEPVSSDLQSSHRFCTRQIVFDTGRPPFDNPEIRQAFSAAVDRQSLAADVLQNAAVPASGVLPPGMPGHVERPAGDDFNLTKATTLLSDGAPAGNTGVDHLTLVAAGVGSPEPLITALVDEWRENLGADIEIELIDPLDFPDLVHQREANMYFLDRCAGYPDPESMLDGQYHSDGADNIGRYSNADVDAILEQARSEIDGDQRLLLYQQAEKMILADAPSVQLVHPGNNILVRPFIHSFLPSPIGVTWPAYVSIDKEGSQ